MTETEDDALFDTPNKITAIYVLYIVSLFTGVPFFIGVILAYFFRGGAEGWARTHYDHQISLFWRFVLGSIAMGILIGISIPLMFILIGFPMIVVGALGLVYLWFWLLFRSLKGIGRVRQDAPYEGPWTFAI